MTVTINPCSAVLDALKKNKFKIYEVPYVSDDAEIICHAGTKVITKEYEVLKTYKEPGMTFNKGERLTLSKTEKRWCHIHPVGNAAFMWCYTDVSDKYEVRVGGKLRGYVSDGLLSAMIEKGFLKPIRE